MKPLPIVAFANASREAREPAQPLRDEVRALVANAPRRVNRLTELALVGAHRCVNGRTLAPQTAIYMACTHGAVADAASMVANAVRGQPSMPVTFINTSSNMAGFYVASTLGLHSGNHVGSSLDFAWEATLELARASSVPVLIGAVEECAWPLAEHRVRLGLAPGAALLETSAWLLADPHAGAPLAWLEALRYFADTTELLAAMQAGPARADTLQVSGAPDAAALDALQATLKRARGMETPAAHSGMTAALQCAEFIERGTGSLLHLSAGRNGAWYLIEIRKP